jgi:hypothetical protein
VVRTSQGFIAARKHRDSVNINANTYNILAARFNDSFSNSNTNVRELSQALGANQCYPNPASNQIKFDLKNIDEIILRNMQGAIISVEKERTILDVSTVPAGLYFINVHANNTWYHSKVLVRH